MTNIYIILGVISFTLLLVWLILDFLPFYLAGKMIVEEQLSEELFQQLRTQHKTQDDDY